jgi:aspartyl-tRNA(Asn)/glutamyl-tRNA(Gln) amidotransferase subunit C
MSLTIAEVKKIAQLSRIYLTPEEEQRYAVTISAVLEYMTILNEVDTSQVEATTQVTGLEDVLRVDEVIESPIKKELIAQMPSIEHDELMVPAVFADEE